MLRRMFVLLSVLLPLLVAGDAWSGSYLNRAALLLDGSKAERDVVASRSDDKELLEMVYAVAQARTAAARRMDVPKGVASAHPHLLLVMENTERAYEAALAGEKEKFVQHLTRARAEDKTFRSLIAELGYTLPKT
jgi:hypothetical protein